MGWEIDIVWLTVLMFGSLLSQPMTVESHLQDEGFQGLVGVIDAYMENGVIDGSTYSAKELAYHIWFVSHGIAMLRITLFRDDQDFIEVSEDVLAAFTDIVLTQKGDNTK